MNTETSRAKKGAGHVYLRSTIWWVKYQVAGEPRYESTKSQDREYAEEYLRLRVAHANSRVPMVERMLAQGLDQLRTRAESCQGTIGAVSELMVSIYLMNHGFDVFRSLSPNATCDLIALRYGKMCRIEVKTVGIKKSGKIMRPYLRNPDRYDHLAMVGRGNGIFFEPHLDVSDRLPRNPVSVVTEVAEAPK